MRDITITIGKRPNIDTDNTYSFSTGNLFDQNVAYQLLYIQLNYSILSSVVTSTLVLSMNQPMTNQTNTIDLIQTNSNVLRSGQPVEILDNGNIVFQGVILKANYSMPPLDAESQSGMFLEIILAPSIYQFSLSPMIFSEEQAAQMQNLLNINIASLLAGGVAQSVDTDTFLNYITSSMDYSNIFQQTIEADDLGANLYVMASVGDSRDTVLRNSINYYNCVFYQQEDGEIIIRQLDATNACTFNVDVTNGIFNTTNINVGSTNNNQVPTLPLLNYDYGDNAYSTPCIVSNYAIVPKNIATAGKIDEFVLSYIPNPQYYPRLQQLQNSGWYVGQTNNTQINQNIVTDPTVRAAFEQASSGPDAYMMTANSNNLTNPFYGAYQDLLTGKELGLALTGYASFSGSISLDDNNLPTTTQNFLGTIIQINNCDLKAGIIATCTRMYTANGSFLKFNVAPLGSITGFWAA